MKKKYERKRGGQKCTPWASEHIRNPLLEHDHSGFFDFACNTYPHYLDTVRNRLQVIRLGDDHIIQEAFTALEGDFFYLEVIIK